MNALKPHELEQSAALTQSLGRKEAELGALQQRLAVAEAAANAPHPAVVDSVGIV